MKTLMTDYGMILVLLVFCLFFAAPDVGNFACTEGTFAARGAGITGDRNRAIINIGSNRYRRGTTHRNSAECTLPFAGRLSRETIMVLPMSNNLP